MRTALWAAFAVLAILTAGCATARLVPLHLDPKASPVPSVVLRWIPPTGADRAVCRRFGAVRQTERSALRFIRWTTSGRGRGTARRASWQLIMTALRWFDDTYEAFGIPAHAGPDLARLRADCASVSVSRHPRGRA